MIIATTDPGKTGLGITVFRGEEPAFWISRLFQEIRFLPPEKLDSDFDWLLVFDLRKFMGINSRGARNLISVLHTRQNRDRIVSMMGFPFFAVSSPVLKKFNLKIEPGFCQRIAAVKPKLVDILKNTFPVWDISSHSLEIETFILNYQISQLRDNQVLIEDYGNFHIDGRIEIGPGSQIGSGVVIKGESKIGKNVHLYPHSYIENTTIEDDCVVLPACVLRDSHLEKNVQVGPYTHLRNHAIICRGAKAGNFVEIKKSTLGKGSKSMHLSYIGDATIGENVNIGAGTITCNYDGKEKHVTHVEDNVFIGSGTELIAPIRIGKNSIVGAGSTLNEDVPEDSLAIARERQVNKLHWTKKSKNKKK
jgi:acyl-[acyl carrier protein]--UDP-N-acetylglucosamine O-acyltransferase